MENSTTVQGCTRVSFLTLRYWGVDMSLVVISDITRRNVKMTMFFVFFMDLRINIIVFLKEVNVSLSTLRRHTGTAEVQIHSFLTLTAEGGEWLTSRTSLFLWVTNLYTHWMIGWVDFRADSEVFFFRGDTVFENRTIYSVAYSPFLLYYGGFVFFLFRFNVFLFKYIPCTLILSKFFNHQLMHKWIVLETILKFTLKLTLKQPRHVSAQSRHHQGAHYSCLLNLQLLK